MWKGQLGLDYGNVQSYLHLRGKVSSCTCFSVSVKTAELWPELKEHSVPDHCPKVKPSLSGRAASDGQQSGGLRNQSTYGTNKEPEILITYNRVSTDIVMDVGLKPAHVFNDSSQQIFQSHFFSFCPALWLEMSYVVFFCFFSVSQQIEETDRKQGIKLTKLAHISETD